MKVSFSAVASLSVFFLLATSSCTTTNQVQNKQSVFEVSVAEFERPIPYPVDIPTAYLSAVERGTRSEDGSPGKNYWQNYAYYTLHAEIDPETHTLYGTSQVTYENNSPHSMDVIVLEIAQNLHEPGVPRNEPVEMTGGMKLSAISANGSALEETNMVRRWTEGASGYIREGTHLYVYPENPLESGGTLDLGFEWSFEIPERGASSESSGRMGRSRGNLYHIAYWYPQISVYDDVYGWFNDDFLSNAEFYHGFADYDVTITIPNDWLVMATGEFVNPEKTLSEETLERYKLAGESDTTITIVDFEDLGNATIDSEDGKLTWRFQAYKVIDVAFSATLESRWDGSRTPVGDLDDDGETDYSRINTFYRESAPLWEDQAEFSRHSISFFSDYTGIPYPWPHMTSVEGAGIIGGGMEFPMMTLIGDYNGAGSVRLYGVTAHELAHMWFPMIISSNERRYTWIDEGYTTFHTNLANIDYYGANRFDQLDVFSDYIQIAGTDLEGPLMRWSDYHYPGPAYTIASYDKPASVLYALRMILGEDEFKEAHEEFMKRWAYKHPYPWDIFRTFEDVTGRDLDWFWRSWYYETWVLDHGINDVTTRNGDIVIEVEDYGNVPMPVDLRVELEDGSAYNESVDVEHWLNGNRTKEVRIMSDTPVSSVEVDPDFLLPDVDRSNNTWTSQSE